MVHDLVDVQRHFCHLIDSCHRVAQCRLGKPRQLVHKGDTALVFVTDEVKITNQEPNLEQYAQKLEQQQQQQQQSNSINDNTPAGRQAGRQADTHARTHTCLLYTSDAADER